MLNCRHTSLYILLSLALFGNTVVAEEEKPLKEAGTTRVVVKALKDERVAEESATSIIQVDSKGMERVGATDLGSALRYEVGINVDSTSSGRLSDVRIRGVGGDRVMIAIDGAPLPQSYSFGYMNIGRGYFDIDAMKTVDVIKGPVSMLYGSSALAGGIFMQTKDPEDFIQKGNRYGGEIKLGYNTAERDQLMTLTGAAKFTDELSAFARASMRKHYEKQNYQGKAFDESRMGSERDHPDAYEANVKNLLTKVVYEPNGAHRFALSYEIFNNRGHGTPLSNLFNPPNPPFSVTTYEGVKIYDVNRRQQVNFRHDFEVATPIFDKGHWMVYYQETRADQDQYEIRNTRGVVADRWRKSSYDNDQLGLNAEFHKGLMIGSVYHEVAYGANFKHNKVKTNRTGDTISRLTGQSIETEKFPNKSFPDSKVQEAGLFIQDRIGFMDGKLEVIAGLRYDHYSLKVKQGGAFIDANPGTLPPIGMNKGHLSKRLALLYYPTAGHTLYANYAEGFKAPAFSAVNTGFANTMMGYMGKSNPNLKPETSKTIELGWNYNDEIHTASIAAYYTYYNNFIEEMSLLPDRDPATGMMVFQGINLDKSYIYGLEAKTSMRLFELHNGDGELRFHGNVAYAKGREKKSKNPIDSVEPLTAILGVSYSYSDVAFVGLNWKLVAPKKESQISAATLKNGVKRMPGYGTLDLVAEYKPSKNVRLNAGIYNILDKKHWHWGNRMSQMNQRNIDRGTQPGMNAALSVTINF